MTQVMMGCNKKTLNFWWRDSCFLKTKTLFFCCQRTKMRGIIPRVIGEAKPMRYEKFNLKGYVTEVHFPSSHYSDLYDLRFQHHPMATEPWWPCRPRWTMAVADQFKRCLWGWEVMVEQLPNKLVGFHGFFFLHPFFSRDDVNHLGSFFALKLISSVFLEDSEFPSQRLCLPVALVTPLLWQNPSISMKHPICPEKIIRELRKSQWEKFVYFGKGRNPILLVVLLISWSPVGGWLVI